MHLRTNIEMSFVHIAILALCPLMFVMEHADYALYFILATCACYFISALVCLVFNKFFSRSVKVFVTAILSVFIVTLLDVVIEQFSLLGLTMAVHEDGAFAIISTTILSIDITYINTKAVASNYFWKILRAMIVFAVMGFVYSTVKEFLAFGTIYKSQIFESFPGHAFCRTMAFNWLWMGIIAFVAEVINRAISKRITEKEIAYQKLLKKIRNEKVFQYDTLRRQKALISEMETNKIDGEKVEEITEKESANEVVDMSEITENQEGSENGSTETVEDKKAKKKRKKLKVSKQAKVEQVFDRQSKEDKE